jgi:putative inorganic carbon (HCO3(-)) transporter
MAVLPLLLTLSRGGWLALIASLAMLGLFGWTRFSKSRLGLGAAAAFVIVLLLIPFAATIGERLYGDDRGSASSRMPLNMLAGAMIVDHPLLGVGANNFAVAMKPYLAHHYSGEFVYIVHNAYLLVWAETGTVGLLAFVWFLLAIVREGIRAWRSGNEASSGALALGCAAAVVGAMVQMAVEPGRGGAAGPSLWLFAGLVTVAGRLGAGSPFGRTAGRIAGASGFTLGRGGYANRRPALLQRHDLFR